MLGNPKTVKSNGLICMGLILATLIIYGQTSQFDFINFDDPLYVSANRQVNRGVSVDGLLWSFQFISKGDGLHWHPLTWLSHMIDCQLFGLDAGAHHLINVMIHALNGILLFFLFLSLTGARWKSAAIAFLFVIHPLNVESVAWIAQRKNVLSTFFFLLTLFSYTRYCRKPSVSNYLIVSIVFVLGLLTKPMLVTLPLVLLLLDVWPLGRLDAGKFLKRYPTPGRQVVEPVRLVPLVAEKIPLVIITMMFVGIYMTVLKGGDNIVSYEGIPFLLRLENLSVSYVSYLLKFFFPFDLSVYYPYPSAIPFWKVMGSIVLLITITGFVLKNSGDKPYLAFGWFWYLITVMPASGLSQTGMWPRIADRWAYMPLIGIMAALVWMFDQVRVSYRINTTTIRGFFLIVGLVAMTTTWIQVRNWESSLSLFGQAYHATPSDYVIHNNLGVALSEAGRAEASIYHFREALRLRPGDDAALVNLGDALTAIGKPEAAARIYEDLLAHYPQHAVGNNNYGIILAQRGDVDGAVGHYKKAIAANPFYAAARTNLGNTYLREGRLRDAAMQYSAAIKVEPAYSNAYIGLGALWVKTGKLDRAVTALQRALALDPSNDQTKKDLEKVQAALDSGN